MREKSLNKIGVGELLFPDESYALMGAAFEVYKELGPGFLEGVYESAFARELGKRNIPFRRQVHFDVLYKGEPLGKHYICDLLVYGKIIIELKAIRTISDIEVAQVLNYLKVTGLFTGLDFELFRSRKAGVETGGPIRGLTRFFISRFFAPFRG